MNSKKTKANMKIFIPVLIFAAIGVAAAIYFGGGVGDSSALADPSDYDMGIEAMPLSYQDMSDSVNVSGKVESSNVWVATTDVQAKVKDLYVSLGDRVESGDALCTFDDTELKEQISQLEEQISQSNALSSKQTANSIRDAELALESAKRDSKDQIAAASAEVQSARTAYKEGIKKEKQGLTDSELLNLLASVESAEGALATAQSGYTQAQAEVEYATAAYNEALQDTTKTDAEVLELKNALATANSNLVSASSNLQVSETQLKSAQAAYNEGLSSKGITSSELDSLKSALDAAKRNLNSVTESSKANVTSAQNALNDAKSAESTTTTDTDTELAKLKRQLDSMTIYAAQSGVITALNISKGSIPNGALMTIEDDSSLKVNVTISEKDILNLSEGMTATITSNALPDETITGVITQVINFATSSASEVSTDSYGETTASESSSYSANIRIDPGSSLLLGMTVKVNIATSSQGESLAVPYDSIIYDDEGNPCVYRGADNGDGTYTIESVPVTEGDTNGYYVAILGDVHEADIIVLYPYMVNEGDVTELSVIYDDTELPMEESTDVTDDEMSTTTTYVN